MINVLDQGLKKAQILNFMCGAHTIKKLLLESSTAMFFTRNYVSNTIIHSTDL